MENKLQQAQHEYKLALRDLINQKEMIATYEENNPNLFKNGVEDPHYRQLCLYEMQLQDEANRKLNDLRTLTD